MSARYRYVAVDHEGRRCKGVIDAVSQEAAVAQLSARGETPIALRVVRARRAEQSMALSKETLAGLLDTLAALMEAGAPLARGLAIVEAEAETPAAARVARLMSERVSEGVGVGQALAVSGNNDVRLAASLASAGEAGAGLVTALRLGADMFRRQAVARQEILKAAAYPAFLIVLAIVALLVLVVFVAPSLAPLARDSGQSDSLLITMAEFGDFLQNHSVLAFGGAAAVLLAGWVGLRAARGFLDTLVLRTPLVGGVVRDLSFGGAARTLGALMGGGVSAARAMDLASDAAGNRAIRARLKAAAETIRDGAAVSTALTQIQGAPAELARLSRIGEEAGALPAMLSRAGEITLARAFRRLSSVAETLGPGLIGAVGITIGFVFWSFLSAVLALGDVPV